MARIESGSRPAGRSEFVQGMMDLVMGDRDEFMAMEREEACEREEARQIAGRVGLTIEAIRAMGEAEARKVLGLPKVQGLNSAQRRLADHARKVAISGGVGQARTPRASKPSMRLTDGAEHPVEEFVIRNGVRLRKSDLYDVEAARKAHDEALAKAEREAAYKRNGWVH